MHSVASGGSTPPEVKELLKDVPPKRLEILETGYTLFPDKCEISHTSIPGS